MTDRGWVCPDPDCPGPPPGQNWCLHRDTEEWRRWLDGELTGGQHADQT